jgi:hypothetical protein
MAVRWGPSDTGYASTSLPPAMPFTITCWMYITATAANSGIWGILGTFNSDLSFDPDGLALRIRSGVTPNTVGPATLATATWYKLAVVAASSAATLYWANAATSTLSSASGTYANPSSSTTLRIGATGSGSPIINGRLAAFKVWSAALTLSEITREFECYVPCRTASLTRFHPFVNAETTDYSGNARTLTGGTGVTTEAGPPIPWTTQGGYQLLIPWDPATAVWYAIYDTATGNLVSGDYAANVTLPLAAGLDYKAYLGQPDPIRLVWDSTALDYVSRDGIVWIDRVGDLVADGTLTAAWAAMSGPQSTAMQNRIGQMLGPFRYRQNFQDIDLQLGFGSPQ